MIDRLIFILLKPIIRRHSLKDWQYWRQWRLFVNITVNAIFMTTKFIVALVTSSIAVLADAIHTSSHFVFYLVMAVGIMWVAQFPKEEQPKASMRFRYSTFFILAFLFIYAGIEFVRVGANSINRLITFNQDYLCYYVGILAFIVILKLFLVRCYSFLDRKEPSTMLVSDSWRHISDAITALAVIPVFFMPYIDGYVSIGVALFIIYSGYLMAQEASLEAVDPQKRKQIDVNDVSLLLKSNDLVKDAGEITIQFLGKKTVVLARVTLQDTNAAQDFEKSRDALEKIIADTYNVKAFVVIDDMDDGESID